MGQSGDVGVLGLGSEVEDDDLVAAFVEPGAGDVEGLLRAGVPEAADDVAVDPEGAFAEVADVEEGVAGVGEGEGGAEEGWGSVWRGLCGSCRGLSLRCARSR